MDDIEHADTMYQVFFEAQVKHIRSKKLKLHNPGQECLSCGFETKSEKHRWCSPLCRDIWSKEND